MTYQRESREKTAASIRERGGFTNVMNLARAVIGFFAILAIIRVFYLWYAWLSFDTIGGLLSGDPEVPGLLLTVEEGLPWIDAGELYGSAISVVLFLIWFYRNIKNARLLDHFAAPKSPYNALMMLIPLAGAYLGPKVMNETNRTADPEHKRTLFIYIVPWGVALTAAQVLAAAQALTRVSGPFFPADETLESLRSSYSWLLVTTSISLVIAILTILVVWRVQSHQYAAFHDLGVSTDRTPKMPPPTPAEGSVDA